MKKCLFAALAAVIIAFSAGCGVIPRVLNDVAQSTENAPLTEAQTENTTEPQTEARSESPAQTLPATESYAAAIDYSEYNGCTYYLVESGQKKYVLDTLDGFKMHCFFRSGSPEYYEVVYTMDLSTAEIYGDTLVINNVKNENGVDISHYFKSLTYSFYQGDVVMKVERDEKTLAGGAEDNILTGTYAFTSPRG